MNAVFAVNALDGFGTGNDMPWPRNREDLKRFRELTTGHTVVMGSGTWLSDMPKPLPNRRNCVLSHTLVDDRCEVFKNISDLLMALKTDEKVFVIGGAKLLWAMRGYIRTVYLTRHREYTKAEITLNTLEYLQEFNLTSKQEYSDHTFEIYTRLN
jgi:dihydrofolate reductase